MDEEKQRWNQLTHAYMFDMITHLLNGYEMFIMHVIKRLIQGF